MARNNPGKSNIRKFSCGGLLLATLVLTAVTFALSADDRQIETIDTAAMVKHPAGKERQRQGNYLRVLYGRG